MPLSGNLSDLSVLETLQMIGLQKKSGTLEIHSGRTRRELRFSEGRLIGCHPTRVSDPDPLTEALVGWGVCDAAAARATRPATGGAPTEEALERLCGPQPELLEEIRGMVIQGVLDQVLLLERGQFRFTTGPFAGDGGWNVEQALLESMRRLDEAADMRASGLAEDRVPTVTGTPGATSALEAAVLRACDGRRNLKEIARHLGLAEYDVLTAIRDLNASGQIRLTRQTSPVPVEPERLVLEQPRRLRNPAVPAVIAIAVLAVAFAGWLAHGLIAPAGWPRTLSILEERRAYEQDRALRYALEIRRLRQGSYPEDLETLLGEGLWPDSHRLALQDRRYTRRPGGDYLLDGISSEVSTIHAAASARSSPTNAGATPSDESWASVSRP